MVSSLYQVLGLSNDATPEQIRKAYRSKALKTHPDRLPPGATPAEKTQSEEQFRKVNNAYEILSDPEKRKLYDLHGEWPPRQSVPSGGYSSSHPYNHHNNAFGGRDSFFEDPFNNDPFFTSSFTNFAFSDPFDLFDSVFTRHHPFHNAHHHRHRHNTDSNNRDQWESPFQRMNHFHSNISNVFAAMERDMMSDFNRPFGGFSSPFGGFPSVMASSNLSSGGGSWANEGFMSTTINGVTHTMHKRRDWDGTEHIYKTYPDGRKVHTINGVPQETLSGPENRSNRAIQPPPPYSSRHASQSGGRQLDTGVPQSSNHRSRTRSESHRGGWQESDYNDNKPVIPPFIDVDNQSKKRWWSRS